MSRSVQSCWRSRDLADTAYNIEYFSVSAASLHSMVGDIAAVCVFRMGCGCFQSGVRFGTKLAAVTVHLGLEGNLVSELEVLAHCLG